MNDLSTPDSSTISSQLNLTPMMTSPFINDDNLNTNSNTNDKKEGVSLVKAEQLFRLNQSSLNFEQYENIHESKTMTISRKRELENQLSPFFILLNHVSHHLLTFLEFEDLNKLRLCCKKLRAIVMSFVIKELSIMRNGIKTGSKGLWFTTNRYIDFRYTIEDLAFLRKDLSINFAFLRRLRIDKFNDSSLHIINQFTHLHILEIHFNVSIRNQRLQLPSLISLKIKIEETDQSRNIVIDTPALRNLFFDEYFYLERTNFLNFIERFQFVNPLTVSYLKVNMYLNAYTIFSNLELLECLECSGLNNRLQTDFKRLSELKIIYYDTDAFKRPKEPIREDKLKDFLRIRRKNLNVICNGFKIQDKNDLRRYDKGYLLKNQLINYQNLDDNLGHISVFDYGSLIETVGYKLPNNLFTKYNNINYLLICRKIENENHLLFFIRECKNLEKLCLLNTSLLQTFYDRLPTVSNLLELEIENEFSLNFEFIMRMAYLVELNTNMDFKLMINMNLNNLKKLKEICFDLNREILYICKHGYDNYEIKNNYSLIHLNNNLTFDDLFRELSLIRMYSTLHHDMFFLS